MVRSGDSGVAAAVLAGGAGSRLGGQKALVKLGGRALIEYPLTAIRQAGLDPFVVTKPGREGFGPDTRTVLESAAPLHPLTGVTEAIRHAGGRRVIVVGCDLPFLPADLISWLASLDGTAVVPKVGGRMQPLVAVYDWQALEALEDCLRRESSMEEAIASLGPTVVDQSRIEDFGAPERIFFNVNTREDLRNAESMLRDHGQV